MRLTLLFPISLAAAFTAPLAAQEVDELQTRVLDDFAVLEGQWVLQADSLSEETLAGRAEAGITQSYISFAFGTDEQWMEFGDYQVRGDDIRHTGAGLIAFSPRNQRVTFTEAGARGASVDGTLTLVEDGVFVREIVVARTDRSWHQTDRWTFEEDGQCFIWQSTYARNGNSQEDVPVRYCRAE